MLVDYDDSLDNGFKVFGPQQLGAQIEILKDYPNKAQNQTD